MDAGINNLYECGKQLNLRNQVISSAAIYYHKFFKNLKNENCSESVDGDLIACTCLYLASKVEESPIKCKELLCAFNEIVNQSGELSFNKFNDLTSSIVFCEMLVCQLIDFELENRLPHKYLLHYLKSLNEWLFNDKNQSVQFSNLCWSLLVDFYKSPDCVQPPPPRPQPSSEQAAQSQQHKSSSTTQSSPQQQPKQQQFEPQEISIAVLQIAIRVFKDKLEQENQNLEQILNYTNRLYDHLDKENLWKISMIIMKTFESN